MASSISKAGTWAFVAETHGNLSGYVIATLEIEQSAALIWEIESPLYGNLHIREIAVDSMQTGKGIARALYGCLWQIKDIRSLTAFIAVRPFKNGASLEFHKKLGFQRAASFSSKEFYGLNDYCSQLWICNRSDSN